MINPGAIDINLTHIRGKPINPCDRNYNGYVGLPTCPEGE